MNPRNDNSASASPLARLLLAGLALNLLLVLPAWWRDGQIGSVWVAPEAWLIPALVALTPGPGIRAVVRAVLAACLGMAVIAAAFDGLVRSVLSRPLNAFIDVVMLRAGFDLIDGSAGRWAAIAASLIVVLAAAGIIWAVWRLLALTALSARRSVLALFAVCLVLSIPWVASNLPGVAPQLPGLMAQQAEQFEYTRRARQALLAAEGDPAFDTRALPGLVGRDVYIVFVESYGASVLRQPRYSDRMIPFLERWRERLESAGLSPVSGHLVAPIRGGQSWLSHATLLSGLEIDSPVWYRMLLARDIDLLSNDFRASGHTALKLAPAIVEAWPEGAELGFDRVYAARDLGYEGPSLGWVTMPDEFTLHAFGEQIRPRYEGAVFAQFALISSHWPWRPVIETTPDPADIGAGRVYDRWRGKEGNPLSLLFDPAGQQVAYLDSIEYSLEVVFDWARRSLPDDAMLIVLGDHQPTSVITGRDVSAAVPIHVISADGGLLAGFRRRGFLAGMVPDRSQEAVGMERFRHWLREDFAGD
ncbi:LTA synthase family protein [Wenzhouxiangella sp. EGI_FJ10305]|uniref:hypothetical protein n=1 Tax=Wenzhouxiangella sp. EGI_FJ10305 TaxID=3243768 RepID=UPI0035DBB8C5